MGYFPFFIDLSNQNGLIVGGGKLALEKIERLLPYGPRLTVCAPEPLPEILAIPDLDLLRKKFNPAMLEGKRFVISASGEKALDQQISALCQEQGILVNVVDDRNVSGFLFPALVKRGKLSIGISTGGASPSAAVYWKKRISQAIPDRFEEILDFLEQARGPAIKALPRAKERAQYLGELFSACMAAGRPLRDDEMRTCLALVSGKVEHLGNR